MTFYCCIEMAQNISQSIQNASEIQPSDSTEDCKTSSDELTVQGSEMNSDEVEQCEKAADEIADNQAAAIENLPIASEKSYSRLCGYMNKLNTKGIIKAFRRRWFVFSEDFCKLCYYRSPDDILPLGEIDISRATFTFDATNREKPGLFTISNSCPVSATCRKNLQVAERGPAAVEMISFIIFNLLTHTPDKEYSLEAKDRHTCLFWLQELQRWRRIFSLKQTQQIDKKNSMQKQTVAILESGLLAQPTKLNNEEDSENVEPILMTHIDCPEELSKDDSARQGSIPLTTIAQQKFQNFRNHMKNSVVVTRAGKSESANPTLTTYIEEDSLNSILQESVNNNIVSEEISPSLPIDVQGNDKGYTSQAKQKSPKMSSIRRKLQGSFRIRRPNSDNERSNSNLRRSLEVCPNCNSCQELQGSVMSLRDDLCAVEDELEASREVVKVLHRQLDDTFLEKETLMRLLKSSVSEDPQGHIKILAQKDHEIAQLTRQLTSQQQECDALRNKNEHLQNETEELKERTTLFQELLIEKDKIVVSLTNEVFDLETEKRQKIMEGASNYYSSSDESQGNVKSKIIVETNETEDLKDAVQAFELQNKFLNKEILELNHLRKDGEKREKKLVVKCSEWEAKCCQTQSKLLYLLKELEKPYSDDQTQEIVARLVEEATTDSSIPSGLYVSTWASNKDYDELGFSWKWGNEENLITTKADNLKQRSEDITNKIKNPEIVSWRVKWDNFMVNIDSKELQRSLELKILIRSGIPLEYKGRIWKRCNDMRVNQFRSQCCPDYYESLLCTTENRNRLDPSAKQIELDLLRTLPNNRHYETLDSDGIPRMRRVLLAYSRHNPAIGYCQGINRLAAISLLFMEEEDAFWCLVSILEYILPPEYYTKTLMASQVDQRVLKELASEKLPRLHNHLEQHNVDLTLYTFNWFLTIFVDNVPVEIYLRIWDAFLYEGSKVLFRFSLAFLKLCENELLQLNDFMMLNKYLRNMGESKVDIKRLVQIAFNELNPFPMRLINHKRLQHTQIVKAQLEELEAIRNSTPSLRRRDEWQSDED